MTELNGKQKTKITIADVAKVCHDANRSLCQILGDHSQPLWEVAPDWQKESSINGVLFVSSKSSTPEQAHENWCKKKLDDGWVYGAIKDVEKKTHPCLVPYNKLPEDQKIKDYLFVSIVKALKGSFVYGKEST